MQWHDGVLRTFCEQKGIGRSGKNYLWGDKMPLVKIDVWAGLGKDTKRKIIQSVSKAISESMSIPIEHIHLVINEAPKDNWGLHGDQASRMK